MLHRWIINDHQELRARESFEKRDFELFDTITSLSSSVGQDCGYILSNEFKRGWFGRSYADKPCENCLEAELHRLGQMEAVSERSFYNLHEVDMNSLEISKEGQLRRFALKRLVSHFEVSKKITEREWAVTLICTAREKDMTWAGRLQSIVSNYWTNHIAIVIEALHPSERSTYKIELTPYSEDTASEAIETRFSRTRSFIEQTGCKIEVSQATLSRVNLANLAFTDQSKTWLLDSAEIEQMMNESTQEKQAVL